MVEERVKGGETVVAVIKRGTGRQETLTIAPGPSWLRWIIRRLRNG